jgi:uncharacterized protein
MFNMINWFEIPAANFDRAVDFYSTVLGISVYKSEFGGMPHGFLSSEEDGGVSGAIVKGNGEPSENGALIYLNAQNQANLETMLSRVKGAGGEVLIPSTPIPPQGYMGVIRDSEGNRIAFHVPQGA